MPRTEEQYEEIREQRKALILDTALELFANQGYHKTSIDRIAKKAKISKGLMYNYFKSKEELLADIFQRITAKMMDMMDPDHDNEITDKEANDFFDKFFDSLVDNPTEWRLFYQLSMQPDVLSVLMKNNAEHRFENSQKIIFDYFNKRDFQDKEIAILIFSSIMKGFTMQYVIAPEMFPRDLLMRFKQKLKEMFLHKHKTPGSDDYNDMVGYFLL